MTQFGVVQLTLQAKQPSVEIIFSFDGEFIGYVGMPSPKFGIE